MKNLRNIFALFILFVASVSIYSCDAEVIIDDPQSEKIDDSFNKTGTEGNEADGRDDD